MRFNSGKRKWSLIHYGSLGPMVDVLEFGAIRYAPNNWMKQMDRNELIDSLLRHVTALVDGETHDQESKLHHIGHILCNAMFYSYHFAKNESKPVGADPVNFGGPNWNGKVGEEHKNALKEYFNYLGMSTGEEFDKWYSLEDWTMKAYNQNS